MGSWGWDWKKGYSFTAPDIVSGPEVKKVPGPLKSETWGPYKKTYNKSMFGQMLFTPPRSVDGVTILCRCREISSYMRTSDPEADLLLGAEGALLLGSKRPACWEDSQTIMNPKGGDTFNVTIGDSRFYQYALNKGALLGALGVGPLINFKGGRIWRRKTRRNKYKSRRVKKTRKARNQ